MSSDVELDQTLRAMAEEIGKLKASQVKIVGCMVQVMTTFYAVNSAIQYNNNSELSPAMDELYTRINAVIKLLKEEAN